MFLSQQLYIGVEVGKSALRFAALRKSRKGWAVSSLKEISGEESTKLFYSQFKDGVLISAMNTRDVLMRSCEIPLKKAKDVFSALDFHVEPLLPYPAEQAIVQAQIVTQHENSTLLTIFAIRKVHLTQHLESLKNYNLEPEKVITRSHALVAFSTLLPQTNIPLLIVHKGEDEISIVLVEKGILLAARSIDPKKDFASEIQKTLLSFASVHKTKSFETIYFIGKDLELKNALQTISGKDVLLPSSPFLSVTQEEFIHFGLAIGTALAKSGPHFRQKELSFPYPFRRLKKPFITFFSLIVLLMSSVYFFGEMAISRKKQAIENSYFALMKAEGITPPKTPFLQTPQDYLASLNFAKKEVQGRPDTFPLLPQLPKVKEILSWLTALPKPQGKEPSSITIESLHYQMVKHPDFTHKQEKYRVRVDLEISAKDPNAARSFHDALKASPSMVDTNEEIQWLPTKGKYKVTFYLKDKTRYS